MELQRKSLLILPAALIGLALAGCGTAPPTVDNNVQSVVPGATSAQDTEITETVRAELAREVPQADIEVTTAQGKVALSGTVEDSDAARRAVRGALAVEGVRGVRNDLTVEPDTDSSASLSAATL
jgi:Flp pilus assembly secretin CpaC